MNMFEQRLTLALAALVSFSLIGVVAIWLRRSVAATMADGFFVVVWIALVAVVGFYGTPLYGAAAFLPAAISAAVSLASVRFVTRLGGASGGWRGVALALGAGMLATVVFPLALLFATVFLGIDGP